MSDPVRILMSVYAVTMLANRTPQSMAFPWRLLQTENFATRSKAAIRTLLQTGRGCDELDRLATSRRGDLSSELSYTPNFC